MAAYTSHQWGPELALEPPSSIRTITALHMPSDLLTHIQNCYHLSCCRRKAITIVYSIHNHGYILSEKQAKNKAKQRYDVTPFLFSRLSNTLSGDWLASLLHSNRTMEKNSVV
jgi:hypothetical protein